MVKHRRRKQWGTCALGSKAVQTRARHIRLVLTDCDGVLTDTGVYYSSTGEELKKFSIRDGMGVQLLREAGITAGIVTGERAGSVVSRAKKLGLKEVHTGIRDKAAVLTAILGRSGLSPDAVAYIGDDLNDIGIIAALNGRGLTAAPSDAIHTIRSSVHYVCLAAGGQGAFREFADWILASRVSISAHERTQPRKAKSRKENR